MDKLKLHSPDFTQANIAKLAELFPNCVTETRDEKGGLKRTIDFDLLKQELATATVEGPQERYQLNWPGKREALLTANAPIAKTLRPCREESVDFDTTQNLFIEGDNLDALKLLQETYLGKVKMIYIDPPYNTGKEFIYDDDFSEDTQSYFQRSNQKDEAGQRMVANPETNGRFHSDWLSMMYPRLKLARNLLRDDGVIFISIDDNEQANLKRLCDEVFGEDNFFGIFQWQRRQRADNRNQSNVSSDHEYIASYSKSANATLKGVKIDITKYTNPDNDARGPWASIDLSGLATATQRPNLHYDIVDPKTGNIYPANPNRGWSKSKSNVEAMIEDGRILFPKSPSGRPREKKFLKDLNSNVTGFSTWLDSKNIGYTTNGTRELSDIIQGKYFDFPKPTSLINAFLAQATENSDIILDFFSGSATTAHAVMQLNAEDNGKRKFIMVQLPEACDEKSEAYKAGYQTIAEIGKERIRRAGQKIKQVGEALASTGSSCSVPVEAKASPTASIDIGFRVLKIDSSNMKDVYYTPDAVQQGDLADQVDNIREGRSAEDLLFQVLLDWGMDLTLPITQETIAGLTVLFVDGNALAACFNTDINEPFVKELAALHPLRVVFRDAGFAGDSVKINIEQIFKLLSPSTEIKTL
ncbi:MAG: site-specific DNA-methyltransferase [Methylococcales bacterium]|nr:site-specific DNA-methyltransferase [Methylococcales bacterium]